MNPLRPTVKTGRPAEPETGSGHTGHFWTFNLGHAITIALLLFSVIGMYFKIDQRLGAVELLAGNNSKTIQLMDDHGTRASQQGIYAESETSKINERRLTALEATVREMGPKLDRVDVNVQWLIKSLAPNTPLNK